MKNVVKTGLAFISVSIGTLIVNDVYPVLRDSVLETIPSLTPFEWLMIVEAIAYSVLAFGVFLIVNSKYRWINMKKSKETTVKQYNAKHLNETVYKKLMRVHCFYDDFLFGDKMGFGIPTNPLEFRNKHDDERIMSIVRSMDAPLHEKYNRIESVITNLEIGERYLKKQYPAIYTEWMQIKEFVSKQNKKYDEFVNYLQKLIENNISKDFPTFTDSNNDKQIENDVYFLENIKTQVVRAIKWNYIEKNNPNYTKIRFENPMIGKYNDELWILYHDRMNGESLMASHDENKLDTNKMKTILQNLVYDKDNIQRFANTTQYDHEKLYKMTSRFGERLETEVVNDIDALE